MDACACVYARGSGVGGWIDGRTDDDDGRYEDDDSFYRKHRIAFQPPQKDSNSLAVVCVCVCVCFVRMPPQLFLFDVPKMPVVVVSK